ncbi:MAG: GIY-YIG nuclease family protein [candidate division NC10 bacterium]
MEEIIWLYVIKGSNGMYYTGITNDIGRRLKEHRSGVSRSTRRYGVIELIWTKVFRERKEAREWEVSIKRKGAGRWLKTYADGNKEAWLKEGGQG